VTTPENKPEEPQKHVGAREARKQTAAARKKAEKSNVTPINRPKPAAKKAPAKKATAPKAEKETKPEQVRDAEHPWYSKSGFKAQEGTKLYEATGESGQISVRSFSTPMTHAVSWAEVNRPGSEVLRKGRIHTFHPNEESAQRMADKLNIEPDRAVVVPVIEYRGQPGDPK
jgi:hypothetical protein